VGREKQALFRSPSLSPSLPVPAKALIILFSGFSSHIWLFSAIAKYFFPCCHQIPRKTEVIPHRQDITAGVVMKSGHRYHLLHGKIGQAQKAVPGVGDIKLPSEKSHAPGAVELSFRKTSIPAAGIAASYNFFHRGISSCNNYAVAPRIGNRHKSGSAVKQHFAGK